MVAILNRGNLITSGVALSLFIVLGACSSMSKNPEVDPITTGSVGTLSIRDTALARNEWRKDPKNLAKGMRYSRQLEALNQNSEQLRLLEQLIKYHPKNAKLMAFYGRRLVKSGQSRAAIDVLKRAGAMGDRDWKTYSALGSSLDQNGKHREARSYYQKALGVRPGEIKILNNMAMSYTLEGQFKQAEGILRKANETPQGRAEPRIRQNLALVVGLQGNFKEAREIASRDLPPEQVEANMAYLRKMLGQSNTWSKLKKS